MQTHHSSDTITVKIVVNDRGNPAGKLADAEVLRWRIASRRPEVDWLQRLGRGGTSRSRPASSR
jgi:hypothetical protein